MAEVQKSGGEAAFIDAEHALDPVYAHALGVDTDSLLVSQPDDGEQALEITEALVRSGAVEVVVVDSVAALVPKSEIDGDMGDSHVGLHARLMSQALRKLSGAIAKSNCIVIFINQLREKVGIVYGNPEVTTGGRALKFYASVRLDVRKSEQLKNGSDVIGNGVIDKSGSWLSYNGEKLGQGKDKVRMLLEEDKPLAEEICEKIMAVANGGNAPVHEDAVSADSLFDEDAE